MKNRVVWGASLLATLALTSCSTSSVPQQGTPAFYWQAARETWAARDYFKTLDHLEKLLADDQYGARARAWVLVLRSGLARGYMELADAFEAGSRANKANLTPFRRSVNTYRGEARRLSLEFIDLFDKFRQTKDENIPLAFSFPTGSATPVMQLNRAANGIAIEAAEQETAEKRVKERAVLLEICRSVGAADDTAKAQESFKAVNVQAPRATFLLAMAGSLYDQSQLYARGKLDDTDKVKAFCTRALETAKSVPESKQSKDLTSKIEGSLKKMKG